MASPALLAIAAVLDGQPDKPVEITPGVFIRASFLAYAVADEMGVQLPEPDSSSVEVKPAA